MKMHWSKSEKENVRLTEAGISKEVSVCVLKTREIMTASYDEKKKKKRETEGRYINEMGQI